MGVKAENIFAFLSGVHPDALAINSTGAATQDGSEFIAEYINNFILGPWQALFDYASVTPNGVTEAAGASQYLTSIEKGFAVGPGKYVPWGLYDAPAVTGDRVLLLAEQGVLIASYVELDAACYVGNGNNAAVAAAGGKFYRSSDSGGATPNIAGPYLQLPANNPTFKKHYLGDGTDFTVTGTNWTTGAGTYMVPYKTSSGQWRITYNINGAFSVLTANSSITVAGINVDGNQGGGAVLRSGGATWRAVQSSLFNGGSGVMSLLAASTFDGVFAHGDVPLAAKPTWADDFEIPWGIVY